MNTNTGEIHTNTEVQRMIKSGYAAETFVPAPFATERQIARGRVGRNELCPCGSGAKFKKCHLSA